MDLRVLHYFLTVAKEQSFARAAAQLHITQPTLSRQLAALEGELGTVLFDRGGRTITLTDEGILLKRRALEIIDLEDKIIDEFKGSNDVVEGKITIGCGEFAAVETMATGTPTEPGKPTGPDSPQTGDNSNMILWIALLFISGGAVIGITVYSKRKKENAE